MTDLEISKALALAIGWKSSWEHNGTLYIDFNHRDRVKIDGKWRDGRAFDYRDWNVAGPIAERFDAFPTELSNEPGWANLAYKALNPTSVRGSTPQEAIAMAVIQGSKPW